MDFSKIKSLTLPEWVPVLAITLIAIGYIFLAGWLGANILPSLVGWGTGVPTSLDQPANNLSALFFRWDSGYYYQTIEKGYTAGDSERAFFPLYPLTVRTIRVILPLPILESGLLVSILSFVGTSLILYRWVRLDYDRAEAWFTIAVLGFFPLSFYLVAFYAESLFLFLSVLGVYWARQGKFLRSGLMIALAGACRPQGFLLIAPYLVEFWSQSRSTRANWRSFLIGLAFAPAGLLAYTIFLGAQQSQFSLAPYFDLLNQQWQTYLTWPWITLVDGVQAALWGVNINPDWFSRAYVLHDLFYALFGAFIVVYAWRRLQPSAAVYLFIGFLYFYTVHGPNGYAFDSMPRRFASLIPIYPALAVWAGHYLGKWRWIVVLFSMGMLGILSAWFASGRWVS